jgi:hypothetical protein
LKRFPTTIPISRLIITNIVIDEPSFSPGSALTH